MNILVIGSGGREHALTWKIAQSPKAGKIYCAPGNAGMAEIGECVNISATDSQSLVKFAKENDIDFVVIGPDASLEAGVADAFEAAGIAAFGPRRSAAIIEYSKVFSKGFMKRNNIPTAEYESFNNLQSASEYVERTYIEKNKFPVVVKADGLAAGKGVIICTNADETRAALKLMLGDKTFGASGESVVIEEYLEGPEISILAFCDGKTIIPMESAQDHKRAYDGDKGPNTGGMGTFSPSHIYSKDVAKECMQNIFLPTVNALIKEGLEFKGVIFFGLMLTKTGVKVIEYNARFGDPETQVVLPRLKTDLLEIMTACVNGTLDKINIEWDENAAACVIMASNGYPGNFTNGFVITGLDTVNNSSIVFHAGTKFADFKTKDVVTAGGRVLGVTGKGATVSDAAKEAYNTVSKISFEGARYRTDIGNK